MATPPTLLCFGMGYSAGYLAELVSRAGWQIIGTSRAPTPHPHWRMLPFTGTWTGELEACTRAADAVLLSIPPDNAGDPALRAFAAAFAARTHGWIGYLSTTGVYGDRGGGWAFEWTPPRPQSDLARRRLVAEQQALALPRPACVFRLPGIYGPGRSALDRVAAGETLRLLKPGQVFSRIHTADLARALALSIAQSIPGRLYTVCDDEPAAAADVLSFAAALLSAPLPPPEPFDAQRLSEPARRFWSENKRVANARAKAELGWRPRFATYREGLRSIHQGDSGLEHGGAAGVDDHLAGLL